MLMTDEFNKKLAIDLLIALCIGLLAVGAVAHANPASLHEGTYAQALRLMQGAPQGASETAARVLLGILSPLMRWKLDAAGLVNFYLLAPLLLLFLSSALAYGALRLWHFGRLEAAGAALLVMLASPVAFAFYPGIWLPETVGISLALLGLAALAASAREKDGPFTPISLLLALAGFGTAAVVLPWTAALPLSLLVGEVALAHKNLHALYSGGWKKSGRLLVLLLPVLLAIALHPPDFVLSVNGTAAFWHYARFAIGLALVAVPCLLLLDKHPQAPLFALAALVAVIFGSISPAAAMLGLLMPAAYGIRTLGMLKELPLGYKWLLFGFAVLLTAMGLFSPSGDWAQMAGLSIMTALAGAAIVHVYGWPGGLARLGLLAFLMAGTLLVAVQTQPGAGAGAVASGPYSYQPLSPGVQNALMWLGKNAPSAGANGGAGPRVAVLAPPEAVQLLSGGVLATDNDAWVRYLASGKNATSPLRRGDYVVAYPELLSQIKADDLALPKPWTLVTFNYVGTSVQQGQTLAVFYSDEGLVLQQALSDNNSLGSGKPQLFNAATGQPAGTLYAGDIAPLMGDRSFRAPGNLLLWYNNEYNANVLRLFRANDSVYQPLYENDTVRLEQVIG